MRWKHTVVVIGRGDAVAGALETYGAAGWELVSVVLESDDLDWWLFFKAPA